MHTEQSICNKSRARFIRPSSIFQASDARRGMQPARHVCGFSRVHPEQCITRGPCVGSPACGFIRMARGAPAARRPHAHKTHPRRLKCMRLSFVDQTQSESRVGEKSRTLFRPVPRQNTRNRCKLCKSSRFKEIEVFKCDWWMGLGKKYIFMTKKSKIE